MNNQTCGYFLEVKGMNYHPGGTAFRIETSSPEGRCQIKPKKDNFGRTHDVIRWIYSGGSPMTVADPCSAKCPLIVPVDTGNLGQTWTSYCPICQGSNSLKERQKVISVKCRECAQTYEAFAEWMQ